MPEADRSLPSMTFCVTRAEILRQLLTIAPDEILDAARPITKSTISHANYWEKWLLP
jgi:hypothetical protein